MKRLLLSVSIVVLANQSVQAGDDAVKQTIAYVQKLQTESGGFKPLDPKKDVQVLPTLRATSSAVRALHYLGGDIPNKAACIKFVESCHDADSGGFTDTPKGKPDVFSTAVGLMAVTELGLPTEKYAKGAILDYLSDNAKTFEDIRIAAAGLERLKAKSPRNAEWLEAVTRLQNNDGSFGKGPGQARATGGLAVTLLRLGGAPDKASVLKVIKAGQRQNGGYGKDDDEIASDLETTYRVMRCFVMLKTKPGNVEGIRSFVAKCRNADGGYANAPGQESSVGGTYFAAIILHWLKENK